MNKTGKLIIGSIAAISLLAGGTVAAYVIVDNADSIGVQVTPDPLTNVVTNDKITLTWGENAVSNVENLAVGSTAKVGTLVLKGASTDAENFTSYTGLLNVALEDITTGKSESDAKFIDYLSVKVLENDVAIGDYDAANALAAASSTTYTAAYNAQGTVAGKTYSVFITLDNSAAPVYSQIVNDKVYLSFNWDKASTDTSDDDTTHTYYFRDAGEVFGDTVYAYAWQGGNQNAAWPGVALTKITGGYFSVDIATSLTNVIFSNGSVQTVDLTLDSNKPYWTLGALDSTETTKYTATDSAEAPSVLTADYYVVGTMNDWTRVAGYAMTLDGVSNVASFTYAGDPFETGAGTEESPVAALKVLSKTDIWYSGEGGTNVEFTPNKTCTGYTVYLNNAYVVYLDATYSE